MSSVFVSHRSSDTDLAERLSADLSNAGHNVWLDEWRIDLGDSIIAKINEGLEGSAYVVVCYSNAGVMSPWMSREWMSSLARQLNGVNVKLMPVLLSGGEPPAIIADVKFADFTKDWSKGVSQLLRALK